MKESKFQDLLMNEGFEFVDFDINGGSIYTDGEINLLIEITKVGEEQ